MRFQEKEKEIKMSIPKFESVKEAMNWGLQKMKEQGGMCKYFNTCYYRGEYSEIESLYGKKCFIGHFISDEDYSKSMENTIASGILKDFPNVFGDNRELIQENIRDFDRIQAFHDCFVGTNEEFLVALEKRIKERYGV